MTDSTGAVIPDATVTVTNIGTNDKRTAKSDAAGNYRVVTLLPTQYKVEIEKANYKHVVQSSITVLVDATARVDVALQVGAATETVEVTTSAPLLQTESGTLGSQVEGKTVQEMPLNGRNTMNLISLVPGVVPQGASEGSTSMNQSGHTSDSGWGNFQIGGSIAGQGVIVIDGAPNNALGGNVVGFVPTQDAVQEFKVSTSATSAEFGRFGGGVVEMSTKSGSNKWHGSAYEYLRNKVLNANIWDFKHTANGVPLERQKWNQNQYGVTASGPVLKDKAFFMFSWEGFSSRLEQPNNTNIPDPGMMSETDPSVPDVFSNQTHSYVAMKEPSTFRSYGTGVNCIVSDDTVAHRTHFNPACLDSASKVLKHYYPNPSSSTKGYIVGNAVGTGNFNLPYVDGDNNKQYNARGDINLSANQRLFVRYTNMHMTDIPDNPMASANGHNTANASSTYTTHQGVIGDTYTINPTTIADVRVSYMRAYGDNLQGSAGSADAKSVFQSLGSGWAPVATAASMLQLPKLAIGGNGFMEQQHGLYQFRAMFLWGQNWYDNYTLSASITKIKGNHTIKAGGEIRLMDQSAAGTSNPSGQIDASGKYTGDDWADFILGLPDAMTMGTASTTGNYNWYQGYYVTDTWNASRKLTINAGLRWELPGAVAERQNRGTVLLPDYINPANGVRGTFALVNSKEWSQKATEPTQKRLLSPRLGAAYRLTNNTVLRAGYALTYIAPDLGTVLPSNSTINTATTGAQNPNGAVNFTVANPFAGYTINMPVGRSWENTAAGFVTTFQNNYAGQAISGPVPTTSFPYMEQWNFAVGQQFKGQQSLEIGYVGAVGIHMLPSGGNWGIDQPNSLQIAAIADCDLGATSTNSACQALPGQANANARANYERAHYTPFPNYRNVTDGSRFNGTLNYNSLQVRYEKRFGSGLITSGYTRSKSIGDADTTLGMLDNGHNGTSQDLNNLKAERSLLSFSIRNRWVTSYVLDMPFGKGKKYFSGVNGLMDRLIGGWAVNGITTFQSGHPLALQDSDRNNIYSGNWNTGTLRPNVDSTCAKTKSGDSVARLGKWFNTSCFSAVSPYKLGTESRVDSALTGDGTANWDFSALKSTKITEKTNLQFRVEFFNIFNHTRFSDPDVDFADSPSPMNNNCGFGCAVAPRGGTLQSNNPRQIQASLRFAF